MFNVLGRSIGHADVIGWQPAGGSLSVYTRHEETVVEAAATEACPVRLQAYWQIASSEAVDLQVLVASDCPVSEVEVPTATRLSATQVLVPATTDGIKEFVDVDRHLSVRAARLTFERRQDDDRLAAPATPVASSAGLLLDAPLVVFRLADGETTYVEMARAEDVERLSIERRRKTPTDASLRPIASAGEMEARWVLFGRSLEKGVILRSRLRAALLPRAADLERARELFQQFSAEPPPLAV
jgi:hypothetical protein